MIGLLAQALDRWILRLATARMPREAGGDPRLAEAAALLRHPDFLCDFAATPADVAFTEGTHFQFPSLLPSPWAENNVVHGRLFRTGRDWQRRPAVVLLHGWNGERACQAQFPWLAWRLKRRGVNAAMIELPYHARRKPRQAGAPRNFISHDLAHTVAAARQSLADTRALLAWLAAQGAPALGLWGFSLGAWLAGLLACHEPRVRASVLLTPVPRMDLAIEHLPFCAPLRRGLPGGAAQLDAVSLLRRAPLVPRQNLLLIAAQHDVFVPLSAIEALWRAWAQPVIWRVPHGHISVLLSLPILARGADWLAGRLADSPSG